MHCIQKEVISELDDIQIVFTENNLKMIDFVERTIPEEDDVFYERMVERYEIHQEWRKAYDYFFFMMAVGSILKMPQAYFKNVKIFSGIFEEFGVLPDPTNRKQVKKALRIVMDISFLRFMEASVGSFTLSRESKFTHTHSDNYWEELNSVSKVKMGIKVFLVISKFLKVKEYKSICGKEDILLKRPHKIKKMSDGVLASSYKVDATFYLDSIFKRINYKEDPLDSEDLENCFRMRIRNSRKRLNSNKIPFKDKSTKYKGARLMKEVPRILNHLLSYKISEEQ